MNLVGEYENFPTGKLYVSPSKFNYYEDYHNGFRRESYAER